MALAKKRLVKSPEGKRFFKKIVQDMNLKVDPDESEDDTKWDMNREMKKFRA